MTITAKDIVSSILRKFRDKDLSPEFIRDESNNICDALGMPRVGDPGRTAREFAINGFIKNNDGTCKYSPNELPVNKKSEFESYQYVYAVPNFDRKRIDILVKRIKDVIGNSSDAKNLLESFVSQVKEGFGLGQDEDKLSKEDREALFGLYLKNTARKKKDNQPLADKTIANYLFYLPKIVQFIKSHKVESIYDISSVDVILQIQEELNADEDFLEANRHSSAKFNYSSSLDMYKRFLIYSKESRISQIEVDDERTEELFSPSQIIYYGVPGCGKSHQIQEDLKKKNITEDNHQVKRVVFHPDYCNADFVGQILPVTKKDGGIRYQFKAGPFTKILRDAYANPDKEYALIIEEINRGNAAAIFGDLFQLLDRKRESDPVEVVNGNSYGPGWSDYCVENDYINAYFRGAYEGDETPNPLPPKTLGKITFNDNVDIRLPPNLSLYATMNTSDQNVFTLDNAFQRRWEMKQISNDLKNDETHTDEKAQYDQLIGNTGVKWGAFREKINEIIMQSAEENGLSSMEDKRLGGWFIIPKKASDAAEGAIATITSEVFAEKVLKYLWDDAFKFDRKSHFGDVKTLEKLIEKFKIEGFKVFSDEQMSGLSQNGSSSTQTGTSES